MKKAKEMGETAQAFIVGAVIVICFLSLSSCIRTVIVNENPTDPVMKCMGYCSERNRNPCFNECKQIFGKNETKYELLHSNGLCRKCDKKKFG